VLTYSSQHILKQLLIRAPLRGLGAFGGFAIPPVLGLFVKIKGYLGYSQGFSIFLVLAGIALILFMVLNRNVFKKLEPNMMNS